MRDEWLVDCSIAWLFAENGISLQGWDWWGRRNVGRMGPSLFRT